MLGKRVSNQTHDGLLAHESAGAAVMCHDLTQGERRIWRREDVGRAGAERAGISSHPDEFRERNSGAPVGGEDPEFRARAGGVRLDAPVLRAEARAVLVRLLIRLYVDRLQTLNKAAA